MASISVHSPHRPINSQRSSVWAGRILTALFAAFMLGASITPKLLNMDAATEMLAALGWPASFALSIGLLELAFLLLYLVPRTAMLGAVLMTALLGGAMATHLRIGSPLLSHTLFSIYLALAMWGGLWLRSPALRAIFPFQHHGG
jgi:hypothetical protein